MKTIKLPYKLIDDSGRTFIKEYMKAQTTVYHIAYNQAANGLNEKSIRDIIKSDYNINDLLDSWFIQSAIRKGIGQYKADVELAKKQGKEFNSNRIFGGKLNFIRRLKGLITKEEYQDNRLEGVYLIGQKAYNGNRKFEFNTDSITFKPSCGIKYELFLPELHKNYKKEYLNLVQAVSEGLLPITVSLDQKYIYLAFEESLLPKETPPKIIKNRYLGIDLNPNYIGVSYYDENKNLLDKQLYNLRELTDKNYNPDKLKHEVREIAVQIGKVANHYQIEYLFVEDLSFKQGDKQKGKSFNRLTSNQFLINEFNRMLSKFGKVIKVNAAYSSTIGNIIHFNEPDPIAASMEIARRGIESRVVKKSSIAESKFYPMIVSKELLQNRWKEEVIPNLMTWVEIHNWLKITRLKYRVDIPAISMFRKFNSRKSKVMVYV